MTKAVILDIMDEILEETYIVSQSKLEELWKSFEKECPDYSSVQYKDIEKFIQHSKNVKEIFGSKKEA